MIKAAGGACIQSPPTLRPVHKFIKLAYTPLQAHDLYMTSAQLKTRPCFNCQQQLVAHELSGLERRQL